jgi:hypothetical protein
MASHTQGRVWIGARVVAQETAPLRTYVARRYVATGHRWGIAHMGTQVGVGRWVRRYVRRWYVPGSLLPAFLLAHDPLHHLSISVRKVRPHLSSLGRVLA